MSDMAPTSQLRIEVARLRSATPRHRFETVVHVGEVGGDHRACPVPSQDPVLDAGTRTDVVSGLLETAPVGPCAVSVWITRAGDPVVQDEDLAWLSAATRAFDAAGRPLGGFWSVTRTGWLDVRSGEGRSWKRLRL